MNYNLDQILAEEYQRILNEAPMLKPVQGDLTTYRGTINVQGYSITIEIKLTDYYPVTKPIVKVISPNINSPNLDPSGNLVLSILDNWDPSYHIPDIVKAIQHEFIVTPTQPTPQPTPSNPQYISYSRPSPSRVDEIQELQRKIKQLQQELHQIQNAILNEQQQALHKQSQAAGLLEVSSTTEYQAKLVAITELLERLDEKFEDGDLGDVAFFRLLKTYYKEKYVLEQLLEKEKERMKNGVSRETKEREAIRS